jgi:hemerythrin superfamily protein
LQQVKEPPLSYTMQKHEPALSPRAPQALCESSRRDPAHGHPETINMNALKLLQNDHQSVATLFARFERAPAGQREAIAARICAELSVHATLEEDLLYPSARDHLGDAKLKLVDHADIEHATLKALVRQIEQSDSSTRLYTALVHVLSEYVKHHVEEEEGEMFPALRKSRLDLDALGRQLAERRQELVAGGALPDTDDDADEEAEEQDVDGVADDGDESMEDGSDRVLTDDSRRNRQRDRNPA